MWGGRSLTQCAINKLIIGNVRKHECYGEEKQSKIKGSGMADRGREVEVLSSRNNFNV